MACKPKGTAGHGARGTAALRLAAFAGAVGCSAPANWWLVDPEPELAEATAEAISGWNRHLDESSRRFEIHPRGFPVYFSDDLDEEASATVHHHANGRVDWLRLRERFRGEDGYEAQRAFLYHELCHVLAGEGAGHPPDAHLGFCGDVDFALEAGLEEVTAADVRWVASQRRQRSQRP